MRCLMLSLRSAGKLCLQLQSARSGTAQRVANFFASEMASGFCWRAERDVPTKVKYPKNSQFGCPSSRPYRKTQRGGELLQMLAPQFEQELKKGRTKQKHPRTSEVGSEALTGR